jgi:ubiquinone/menaquinone biosynthesis C-methylase UbiE
MLTRLLHDLVARPWVYDLCQTAVGAKAVRRRLAAAVAPHAQSRLVIDIGGGTGAARAMWSAETKYVCLDIDPLKLQGYAANNPGGLAVLADATDLPIRDRSVDSVVCTSVTHHLLDPQLDRMLSETARVLKPTGRLILLDALWKPRRLPGRLLWRYDRGSHPRPAAALREHIARHFTIDAWDEFAVLHAYAVLTATPKVSPPSDSR